MIFSPITERSLRVRLLYAFLYLALSVGGLSMVGPFLLMLGGAVEPGSRASHWGPTYLFNESDLWQRYLQAKYRSRSELLRMAWGNPEARITQPPPPRVAEAEITLWEEFQAAHPDLPEMLWGVGFCDVSVLSPHYYNREFRRWLEARYGTREKLNEALGTTFRSIQVVLPPNLGISGPPASSSALAREFLEFSAQRVPASRKFAWDAAGFYRSVFLPRTLGGGIKEFNTRYGTRYTSFEEVPFSATVPEVAADSWFLFVGRMLRPDLVELTEEGQARHAASGLGHQEFLRVAAKPEDVRVVTLDRRYAEWAERLHGIADARIPQPALDSAAFSAERGFWKRLFLTQNFQHVLDALFFHGTPLRNTLILVGLTVGGALLVNPLAAYALSRFRMRQTYSLLLFFLATLAFPAEVTMIPVFLQLKELNLLNTFGALVLPTLANGFSIFMLKGFFDTLPRELYEAAEIDGASEWTMFWLIAMNLSRPILAVMALNAFVSAYGAFFYALILAPDPRMWTIMVYVYQLQQSAGTPIVYASLILTALPTLLVFILCQNVILRGIAVPTEK